MLIVPIAHHENTARRWPLIALLLVLANVAVHVGLLVFSSSIEMAVNVALSDAVKYAEPRPYLAAPCLEILGDKRVPGRPPSDLGDADLAEEQAEMARLCAAVDAGLSGLPTFRFGDVPKRGGVLTLFSHQFLHGGWLHLLFNLWFLWLTAANLEDRWGRVVFPLFYLLSGVAGGLLHRAFNPGSPIPLIGASGAIAGAMGGFLVCFASTHIRFFYLIWIGFRPKWGTFEARAVVMLPLWLLSEVASGLLFPGSGTAHWAHVGGFVFGAVVALGMRLSGIDQKLDSSVDAAASTMQDARILRAGDAINEGRAQEAVDALRAVLAEQPSNLDAQLELLRAARALQDRTLLARATVDLALLYAEAGDVANVGELLLDLPRLGLGPFVPRDRFLRLGERLAQKGHVPQAVQVFHALHTGGASDELAARAAAGHAMLLMKSGQLADARVLIDRMRGLPLTADAHARIESVSNTLSARGG